MYGCTDVCALVTGATATAVTNTVARSIALTGTSSRPRKYKVDTTRPEDIDWASLPLLKGTVYTCMPPESLGQLLHLLDTRTPLGEDVQSTGFYLKIQVYRNPDKETHP